MNYIFCACMEASYSGEWEIGDTGKEKITLVVGLGLMHEHLMLEMIVF